MMDDRRKVLFFGELGPLMLLSHVVLGNNLVTDRFMRRRYDLPVQAWSTLYALSRFPGIRAKEVAELFPRPQNTISRSLAMLKSRKLILERVSQDDAREKLLYTTEEGERLLRELLASSLARQQELFGILSPAELADLSRLLLKVTANPRLNCSEVMGPADDS